jgi:hypothetical protein
MSRKTHAVTQQDEIIKAVLIGAAVISFWRGVWGLMDIYLFPNNPAVSFVISLLMGVAILYGTNHISKKLSHW